MSCPYTKEDLSAFIDGEVDEATGRQIRRHLQACPECQREAASLRTVARMVRALPRSEPKRSCTWDTGRLAQDAPRVMRCTVVVPAASAYLDGELCED
jgi:anti-sigma factor RsiW